VLSGWRGQPQPRAHGACPRKLRHYVPERNVIGMKQAVHSSTALPAQVFAIQDRGVLRHGATADVLVFDREAIRVRGTQAAPHACSEGMEFVFVNRRTAVTEGKVTPKRFGRLLPRAPASGGRQPQSLIARKPATL